MHETSPEKPASSLPPLTNLSSIYSTLLSFVPNTLLRKCSQNPTLLKCHDYDRFPATILFIDVSGFTALNERLANLEDGEGPEQVTKHLNEYFGRLMQKVADHKGDIIKFAGDALICLFGVKGETPEQIKRSAYRAVACGLAIQNTPNLREYNSIEGISLTTHLGIGSGDTYCMNVGGVQNYWEFLVAGEPFVQLKTAVEESDSGELVVSDDTWQLVNGWFRSEARGDNNNRVIKTLICPPSLESSKSMTSLGSPLSPSNSPTPPSTAPSSPHSPGSPFFYGYRVVSSISKALFGSSSSSSNPLSLSSPGCQIRQDVVLSPIVNKEKEKEKEKEREKEKEEKKKEKDRKRELRRNLHRSHSAPRVTKVVPRFTETADIRFEVDPSFPHPRIRSATEEGLVRYFTIEPCIDISARDAFLMTFRMYLSPQKLLNLLITSWNDQDEQKDEASLKRTQLRMLTFLKVWLEKYSEDFEDLLMKSRVQQFIDVDINKAYPNFAVSLNSIPRKKHEGPLPDKYSSLPNAQALVRPLEQADSSSSSYCSSSNEEEEDEEDRDLGVIEEGEEEDEVEQVQEGEELSSKDESSFTDSSFTRRRKRRMAAGYARGRGSNLVVRGAPESEMFSKFCGGFEINELAEQVTLYQHCLFSLVRYSECFNGNWVKKKTKVVLAPNLTNMISFFNRFSKIVMKDILTKKTAKFRAIAIEYYVELAKTFMQLKNFEGCMCVVSALNSCSIQRLKNTWLELKQEVIAQIKEFQKLTSHSKNYKRFRRLFLLTVPPLVPVMAIYLSDLTFIEGGNPSIVEGGRINFDRYHQLATVISKMQQYQQDKYPFQPNPTILNFMFAYPVSISRDGDDEIYSLSLKVEPLNPYEAVEKFMEEEDRLKNRLTQAQLNIHELTQKVKQQNKTIEHLNTENKNLAKMLHNLYVRVSDRTVLTELEMVELSTRIASI
eukprot:TRINITY_DN1083_c0_g1_i1.p1 TRINITY_DN1083_c0_g1~~TRINITY_DN1083_c0_g1_i1.p1  ORF type:complete len:947 (-),score=211.43 TRINITY_DN1083_c0_g1_i1:42-2882(-)